MPRSKKSTTAAAAAAAASTVDTISSLPDAILCRILSFFTTKEAVATSILSKRWIHLWHHVPNLNFPYINVDTVNSGLLFNEFVYSVLLSREIAGSNLINSFTLHIQYDNPHLAFDLGFPNITKWINVAVQRKLKHLCLGLDVDNLDDNGDDYDADYPNLPVSIFTCTTLVNQLQRPYHVIPIFHNLTDLVLHHDRWDLIVQVLHQCPKLQNLELQKGLCDSFWCEVGDQENWVEPEFVPQCLLSSLRTFTIHDLSDLPSDLMLEQYILKNATILQTMTIWCKTEQPEMDRKLSMCPVASATCELSLCC